jgi:hypothetical protein
MTFSLIHPAVVDLYLLTLKLNDLGLQLDGYIKYHADPPKKLQIEAEDASTMFINAEKKALEFSGSRRILNEQLMLLHTRRGLS